MGVRSTLASAVIRLVLAVFLPSGALEMSVRIDQNPPCSLQSSQVICFQGFARAAGRGGRRGPDRWTRCCWIPDCSGILAAEANAALIDGHVCGLWMDWRRRGPDRWTLPRLPRRWDGCNGRGGRRGRDRWTLVLAPLPPRDPDGWTPGD